MADRGQKYGEDLRFFEDETGDTGTEWNPHSQASRNRPRQSFYKSDYERDYNVRRNPPRRDDMWNESFHSERVAGSFSTGEHYGKGPKGWKRSDDRIREEASEALYRDYHVDASEIELEVKEGIVTLTGAVSSRDAKRIAEDCVEHVYGVIDVQNRLEIRATDKTNISNLRNSLS